jgi:hypothetical protein
MRPPDNFASLDRKRTGKTLVMFVLLLPVLLGIVGLAIDCGLLMVSQREAQNAADAAAMAAAMAHLAQQASPQDVATALVTGDNQMRSATLSSFNHPPASGPHAGSAPYYEVVVAYPVSTLFMPVLGTSHNLSVHARAVAGIEAVAGSAAIALLDPTAAPGLSIGAEAGLIVNGRVVVNSIAGPAAVAAGSSVEAADYQVAGPTVTGSFSAYPGTAGRLRLNQPAAPDPLIHLATPAATPSAANNTACPIPPGWSTQILGSPTVTDEQATGLVDPNSVDASGTVHLYPGVYGSITVSGGTVNFSPGVYILSPSNSPPYALDVSGGRVTGAGVLFYNTGGDFVPATGYPDSGDASLYAPGPSGIGRPPGDPQFQRNFAPVRIDASGGGGISLTGLNAGGDPFSGMLIYQRRANTQPIAITGSNLALCGTIYATWSAIFFSGGGNYQSQVIAGSMQVSGTGVVSLNYSPCVAKAPQVFLVE